MQESIFLSKYMEVKAKKHAFHGMYHSPQYLLTKKYSNNTHIYNKIINLFEQWMTEHNYDD